MDEFLGFLVTIIVAYSLFASFKKSKRNANTTVKPSRSSLNAAPRSKNRNDGSGHIHKFEKGASVSSLLDDRENDWLANQLRDEHRAFKRISDMFDLKIEHVSHCDARLLNNYHRVNCDANAIDTAEAN